MIVAYHFAPYDGVGNYFNGKEPAGILCPECECVLDESYVPKRVSLRRPYEVASTYDNRTIVSERFKRFCRREGAEFILVNERRRLYFMRLHKVLRLDISHSNTRFGAVCRACGQHKFIVGTDGIRLRDVTRPIRRGLYRSDLLFGSGSGKYPMEIVGTETKQRIDEGRFRGVLFLPLSAN